MKDIVLTSIPKDELVEEIVNKLKATLSSSSKKEEKSDKDTLIKPKEAASFLKVSLVTINEWTKKGILTSYSMGRRKFYKKNEIIEALSSTKKYQRVNS